MKKRLLLLLALTLLIFLMVGCTNQPNESEVIDNEVVENEVDSMELDARIEEVSDTELLARASNSDQFDLMRINIEGIKLDFTPLPGQMVHVKIKNQVGMSNPPYTIALEMTLLGP